MSDTIIGFTFFVDDVATAVTSAVLTNPDQTGSGGPAANTYGVRRVDTLATVIAANTPLVSVPGSPGQFTYSFTDPAENLVYNYWIKVVYNGATYTFERNKSAEAAVSDPTCPYTTYARFIRRWGTKLIATNTNKDATTNSVDLVSVQEAFDFAVDEIHAALQGGIYAVPLNFSLNGGVVPRNVSEWVHVIAFEYLYNARGLDDKTKYGNKLTMQTKRVFDQIKLAQAGLFQIPAVLETGVSLTPSSIRVQFHRDDLFFYPIDPWRFEEP